VRAWRAVWQNQEITGGAAVLPTANPSGKGRVRGV